MMLYILNILYLKVDLVFSGLIVRKRKTLRFQKNRDLMWLIMN